MRDDSETLQRANLGGLDECTGLYSGRNLGVPNFGT